MKFTTVASDAFQKFQMNAGVLLTQFDPASPAIDRTKIIGATSGGCSFTVSPEFIDFGEDVDNVPNNTKELKVLKSVTATMTGTFKTVDAALVKRLIGAANYGSNGKITPRADLAQTDFVDIWWVGDYSDKNNGVDAGFMAIRLINALSTGGFQIQSNDDGKGDFAFEFTGHYSIADMTVLPYEIYVQAGLDTDTDTSLSALTIGSLTLSPTFDANTLNYTATTSNASETVTATATDSTNAVISVIVNGASVTNGTSASLVDGPNSIVVTVTNNGLSTIYTATVTKGA